MQTPPPGLSDNFFEDRDGGIRGERAGRPGRERFTGELIDDVEEPQLSSIGGDVELEVQRPHLVGTLAASIRSLRCSPSRRRLRA